MKILTVIPARGGSKGIPGKNLALVGGVSLLGRTIQAAKSCRNSMRVVVSTDAMDIAAEADQHGAEVVIRPPELSGDFASSEVALRHVLDHLSETEGYEPDLLVFLQCTSPLTIADDIDGTVDKLLLEEADSAMAVAPYHYFLWAQEQNGSWVGINHDKTVRLMRQEREPQYVETGAVYVMRVQGFLHTNHRFFGKTVAYITPSERHWEIDEPHDLRIAEMLVHQKTAKNQKVPKAVIFDFDGVFTNNKVYLSEDGLETVRCDRGDGMGIGLLRDAGIPMMILSKERNPVVTMRAKKLNIPCRQGIDGKRKVLLEWLLEQGVDIRDAAYLGNDINDLECLEVVGHPYIVADAHTFLMNRGFTVLSASGGDGAVREMCDIITKNTAN